MKAQVETISPVKTRLSVEVSADEIAREEDLAYRELRRTVTLPGFRKGKAPVSELRRIYGARVRSDVLGRVIERTYRETLLKEEIVPVADADIQIQSDPADSGLSYTAVVEVRPRIEPRGYTGLSLRRERVAVEDAEVEARLEGLRSERATFDPAPEGRTVQTGDMIVIDYDGAVDGEPFEGGSGKDRTVVVGSGMFIPGFEEGLVGAAQGQTTTVEVAFPEDYRVESLAGRDARFEVLVKEVKVRRLPDLDDEFAREVAGAENLEGLRARIREAIGEEKQRQADRRFREQVIDALLDANPFEVPESLVRSQQAHSLERVRTDLARRGLDLEALGIEEAKIQESHHRAAERAVRWAFLMQAITEAEGIEVTDADVDERIREIAAADGRPYALVRSFFEEHDQLGSLRSSILERRLIDHVASSATIVEVDAAQTETGEDNDE